MLLPCVLFLVGLRRENRNWIRVAAVLTLLGIVLNRLNISVIAFKWDAPVRYVPSWMEIEVTLAVLCAEIWAFRWVVNRMPVLRALPSWAVGERTESPVFHHRRSSSSGAAPREGG